MHITEEHLRHMARRHHATMQKLDAIKETVVGTTGRLVDTIETAGFAWIGGATEGRSGGWALGPVPLNLLLGVVAVAASHTNRIARGRFKNDLSNAGNGLIGSWAAAVGFAFGKRARETGSLFGGGGHPFTHPYENGWPHAPATP